MATFDQFINSIIADGNDGKAFEKFCKHFLEASPEYAHQFEKVWLWDDWPNKWSHDKGIDLVAKYKGRDTYCAIQAKCYAAHNTVPYNEVTNFLADSSRAEIEDRILMMSTNKLNEKTSKEVISGQEKQVTILDRNYFENKAKFDYPSHISELGKAKAKPPATPRKHQITAINDVEKGLQENDRGQLIMACGTGKTFTTLWIKERLMANTVLVLLPSLSLLSQTMREWVWGANERFEALAVCSDPTVGKSKNSDEDISTAEVGRVTWHVDEIQDFLRSPNPKVIFCTYQSSELIHLAQENETIPQFDLVVCDEAHRCAGKANAGFATILHEEKIRAKKRLFTTATPRYYGKSVQTAAEGRGVEVIGMDDEAKFGPVVHKLTFGQAIEMDMLTDYQVVVVGVDEPMVREWISEGEIVSFGKDNQTDARTLAAKIAVLKAIKDYGLNRIISFHTNIKRAKEFASDVFEVAEIIDLDQRPAGNIWSKHVDGTMSAGKRRDLINGLKELDGYDIGLLTNARCLSEGVDVPSLDGVAFVDPRGSQVDIIQAVGRAIRKSDNKTKGTIILPVFLAAGDDPDSIIDASNFKPVWDVLKALRAHDEVLADKLNQYRINMGLGVARNSNQIEKLIFDLPIRVSDSFADALTNRLVDATSNGWEVMFNILKYEVEQIGKDAYYQQFVTNSGLKLGSWCQNQRGRQNELSKDQISRLESLPGWSWSIRDMLFEEGYSALLRYTERFGTATPTNLYEDEKHFQLGRWVSRARFRKQNLSKKEVGKLESLAGWSWDPIKDAWEAKYEALKRYCERESDANLNGNYVDENGLKLGQWVRWLRTQRTKLDEEKINLLENLPGWSWTVIDNRWQERFDELKKFVDNNGALPTKASNKTLSNWWSTQNRRFRKKIIPNEQLKKLQQIPFWQAETVRWENELNHLRAYVQENGHARPPKGMQKTTSFDLAQWVNNRRSDYKKGILSDRDIELLESFEGWTWDVNTFLWNQGLEGVKEYIRCEGNSMVPTKYETADGFKLGQWVGSVRQRRDKLTPEQIADLEMLPSWEWNAVEAKWNEGFDQLVCFVEEFGHANPTAKYVSKTGYKLGHWVHNKRARKAGQTELQQEKLSSLPGWKW